MITAFTITFNGITFVLLFPLLFHAMVFNFIAFYLKLLKIVFLLFFKQAVLHSLVLLYISLLVLQKKLNWKRNSYSLLILLELLYVQVYLLLFTLFTVIQRMQGKYLASEYGIIELLTFSLSRVKMLYTIVIKCYFFFMVNEQNSYLNTIFVFLLVFVYHPDLL